MYFYPRRYRRRKNRSLRVLFAKAKQLRTNLTRSEAKAWKLITDIKPRKEWMLQWVPDEIWRQDQTICPWYILDFYCPQLKLAVEIDGAIHEGREVVDRYRDNNLRKLGITTIRFPNETVLFNPEHFIEQLTNVMRGLEQHGESQTNNLQL